MLEHTRDVGRAEDALTPSYGTETIGMQRDWNEELQSCREFPRTSLQDRFVCKWYLSIFTWESCIGLSNI